LLIAQAVAANPTFQLSFIHGVFGGPNVDVLCNNEFAWKNVSAGTALPYVPVEMDPVSYLNGTFLYWAVFVRVYVANTSNLYLNGSMGFTSSDFQSGWVTIYGTPANATFFGNYNYISPFTNTSQLSAFRSIFIGPSLQPSLSIELQWFDTWLNSYYPVTNLYVEQIGFSTYSMVPYGKFLMTISTDEGIVHVANITLAMSKSYTLVILGNATTGASNPPIFQIINDYSAAFTTNGNEGNNGLYSKTIIIFAIAVPAALALGIFAGWLYANKQRKHYSSIK